MGLLQLWAHISPDRKLIDSQIVNPDKYPSTLGREYRLIMEHEDIEFLESIEGHLKSGQMSYPGSRS